MSEDKDDILRQRTNAKEQLGEWFAGQIKESTRSVYKALRKQGWEARIALHLAKCFVGDSVNDMLEANFHSKIPN